VSFRAHFMFLRLSCFGIMFCSSFAFISCLLSWELRATINKDVPHSLAIRFTCHLLNEADDSSTISLKDNLHLYSYFTRHEPTHFISYTSTSVAQPCSQRQVLDHRSSENLLNLTLTNGHYPSGSEFLNDSDKSHVSPIPFTFPRPRI
jgi:hypothetical protein